MKINFLKAVLMFLIISLTVGATTQNIGNGLSSDNYLKKDSRLPKSEETNKIVYGYRIYDYENPFERGPVYFDINASQNATLIRGEVGDLRCSSGGAYYDGYLYAYIYELNDWGMIVPLYLEKINLNTGEEFQIADYRQMTFLFQDMTYDYTTNMMYYTAIDGNKSKLGTVNLENGKLTHVADINIPICALACDMEGQMYAVTKEGNLAKLNKTTGQLTTIGNTGIIPMLIAQSMDFDHDNGTLYWSVATDLQTAFCTIDISTGLATPLGLGIGYYSQITSLYVPFTSTPSEFPDVVTNLNVIVGADGALNSVISFQTPTTTVGGDPLTSISKIEIYRSGVLINTIDNPISGSEYSFTDNVEQADIYAYRVIASNHIGAGKPAVKTVFVGEDVPAAPTELTLTKNGTNAILNWTAPTIGLRDGWIDTQSLSYNITRYPDNVAFISATNSFTDTTISGIEAYSYKVECKTNAGIGGNETSNSLIIGQPFDIPYNCEFKSLSEFRQWTIVNENNDEFTWQYSELLKDAFYACNIIDVTVPAKDWIISPQINLTAGLKYRLKFDVRAENSAFPERLKVYYGQGVTVEEQTNFIKTFNITSTAYKTEAVTIEPTVSGAYNFGFLACSDADMYMLHLSNISVEIIFDNDLMATTVAGNTFPMISNEYTYNVTVVNNGSLPQNNYEVQLIDQQGNVLATTTVNETIQPGASKKVAVIFTPTEEANKLNLMGNVVLQGDERTSNDRTQPLIISILPVCNQQWITTYQNGTEETVQMPFNFLYKTSVVQTIYPENEIGSVRGDIKSMVWFYSNLIEDVNDKSVKIYIANTNLSSLTNAWIPQEQFTLVYEGKISVPVGINEVQLILDVPFNYEGGNICVMTVREMDTKPGVDRINTLAAIKNYGQSRVYYSDNTEFDFTQEGISLVLVPKLKMLFTNDSFHTITATAQQGGTISPEGEIIIGEGKDLKFTITPDTNFKIKDIIVDGVSLGSVSTYTFKKITDSHSIIATFEQKSSYSITATAQQGGTITPEGEIKIEEGKNLELTITPDTNFKIKDIVVDGESVGSVSKYTFKNITANHTILAIFEDTSSIDDLQAINVSVYPNPVKNTLTIQSEYNTLYIYTTTNKLLIKATGDSQIDLSTLPSGTYIVRIINNNGVATQKIIKQ